MKKSIHQNVAVVCWWWWGHLDAHIRRCAALRTVQYTLLLLLLYYFHTSAYVRIVADLEKEKGKNLGEKTLVSFAASKIETVRLVLLSVEIDRVSL